MKRPASTHERLAERLARILTKLNVGYQLGAAELAAEFQVSTRTIERDFDRLRLFCLYFKMNRQRYLFGTLLILGRFKLQDIQNFCPAFWDQ